MEHGKISFLVNTAVISGILLVLLQVLVRGRGGFGDYIFQAIGGLLATALIAFILSLIPYVVLKKRVGRAKFISFSVMFLLVSIVSLIGAFQ